MAQDFRVAAEPGLYDLAVASVSCGQVPDPLRSQTAHSPLTAFDKDSVAERLYERGFRSSCGLASLLILDSTWRLDASEPSDGGGGALISFPSPQEGPRTRRSGEGLWLLLYLPALKPRGGHAAGRSLPSLVSPHGSGAAGRFSEGRGQQTLRRFFSCPKQ